MRITRQWLHCLPAVTAFAATCAFAGYPEAKQALQRHDYQLAHSQCIHAANVGNPDCQNLIGYLVRGGLGVEKNPDQAQSWFLYAAKKKHPAAQYNLALMYSSGELGTPDHQQAAKWLLQAAEQNNLNAQVNIGTAYSLGIGVPVSPEKAFTWWQRAAVAGSAMAQNNLGWSYMTGKGVAPNAAEATLWLTRAASQNADLLARDLANKNLAQLTKPSSATPNEFRLGVNVSAPDSDGRVQIVIASIGRKPVRTLRLSGRDFGPSANGDYKITRHIPVGQSYIDIYAESQSGEKFSFQQAVFREVNSAAVHYPDLDPSKIVATVRRDAVAVVIGIESYESLPRADFSDNDARTFYDYADRALGVPKNKIKLLSGTQTKRSDILLTLKNWLAAEVNPNQTDVYVFYSGHGLASADGKKRFLLPQDANINLIQDTALPHDFLIQTINAHQPKSLTLLLDSCYSGTSRSGTTLIASARPVVIQSENEALPSNTSMLSSSSGSQISTAAPEMGHGLFSYFLMRGLEGDADGNRDGKISLTELHQFVAENVSREALRRGMQQTPSLAGAREVLLRR